MLAKYILHGTTAVFCLRDVFQLQSRRRGPCNMSRLPSVQSSYSHELLSHHSHADREEGHESERACTEAVGIPSKKPTIRALDVLNLGISLCCYTTAVVVLRITYVAWYLGFRYQLVVIGLMLSIMNACLSYARPFLFVLLEARYGRSTLHNFDAILLNSAYGSRTDIWWRVLLLGSWLLPIVLSVAYKLFPLVTNSTVIHYTGPIKYGFYPPVGLQKPGQGVALMTNLSLPFIEETSAPDDILADPEGGVQPRPYGLNTLLISNTSVAALDLPSPEFVTSVRQTLREGETWSIETEVLATVTQQNLTVEQHRELSIEKSRDFWQYYLDMVNEGPATAYMHKDSMKLWMLNCQNRNDLSWLFLSLQDIDSGYEEFYLKADMFGTWREPCMGKWNITRTTMQLVSGMCRTDSNSTKLDPSYQDVFTNNRLGIHAYFLPTLHEYLAPFATARSASEWRIPTMAAMTADMMYSRVAAWTGTGPHKAGLPGRSYPARGQIIIISTRPGIRGSIGLLVLLAIQPSLLILSLLVTRLLYAVPIDRNFGLISILAGVNRSSLQVLKGASLSAELCKTVGLRISVRRSYDNNSEIVYTIDGHEGKRRDSINSKELYR